ncbi:MAG: hypothetical protein ACE366_18620 [Bradymonadia bacterium]
MKAILIDEAHASDHDLTPLLEALSSHNIDTVIRVGAAGPTPKGVHNVIRSGHRGPNDIHSLFALGSALMGPFIVCLGRPSVTSGQLARVLATPSPGALAVSHRWRNAGETPPAGTFLTQEEQGYLMRLSTQLDPMTATGVSRGILRFDAPLTARLWGLYLYACSQRKLPGTAAVGTWDSVGLSDLINVSIEDEERFLAVALD